MSTAIAVRFWRKVLKSSGCWRWMAATRHGYGAFGWGVNDVRLAHRVAWEWANGPIPAGMILCHRCDNPLCVRPDHMFLGTHADNVADKVAKGRGAAADRHGRRKLSAIQVLEIRRRRASGERGVDLAHEFGISQAAVSVIHRRLRWRSLHGEAT